MRLVPVPFIVQDLLFTLSTTAPVPQELESVAVNVVALSTGVVPVAVALSGLSAVALHPLTVRLNEPTVVEPLLIVTG